MTLLLVELANVMALSSRARMMSRAARLIALAHLKAVPGNQPYSFGTVDTVKPIVEGL